MEDKPSSHGLVHQGRANTRAPNYLPAPRRSTDREEGWRGEARRGRRLHEARRARGLRKTRPRLNASFCSDFKTGHLSAVQVSGKSLWSICRRLHFAREEKLVIELDVATHATEAERHPRWRA